MDERTLARFASKVAVTPDGCHRWMGAHTTAGYGLLRVKTGAPQYVHRLAWEHANGPIPDGLQIDHLCRVRDCVNPDHMEVVTSRENTRRGRAAQSRGTCHGCGVKLTDENTYRGARHTSGACRDCERAENRRRYARRKGDGA